MELPPEAYSFDNNKDMFCLRGNKYNSEGVQDSVLSNSIRITSMNLEKKIHQFDVSRPQPSCQSFTNPNIGHHLTRGS